MSTRQSFHNAALGAWASFAWFSTSWISSSSSSSSSALLQSSTVLASSPCVYSSTAHTRDHSRFPKRRTHISARLKNDPQCSAGQHSLATVLLNIPPSNGSSFLHSLHHEKKTDPIIPTLPTGMTGWTRRLAYIRPFFMDFLLRIQVYLL